MFFPIRRHVPIEVYLKLLALIGAIIGEYMTMDSHRANLQHIMMYAFFAFHPIFELLYHHKVEIIPKKLDYLSAILAFGMEAFLFHEHLHGRPHMDIQLHTYLILAVIMCGLSAAFEMYHINDVRPALARACFTMLQGTWFYQVRTTCLICDKKVRIVSSFFNLLRKKEIKSRKLNNSRGKQITVIFQIFSPFFDIYMIVVELIF